MSFIRNAMIALAFAAAVPAAVSAQGPMGQGQQGGPRRGGMPQMLLQDITLSADQQAQVEKVNSAMAEEMRALGLMQRGGPAPDSATRAKRNEMRKKHMAELRKILTAEQQKTFDANAAEMDKRMQEMRRN